MGEPLTFEQYATMARRTAPGITLAVAALGVAGEAGEVADIVKKIEGHGLKLEETRHDLILEIGDLLWYCSALCDLIGVAFEIAAHWNVQKLEQLYPEGFRSEAPRIRENKND